MPNLLKRDILSVACLVVFTASLIPVAAQNAPESATPSVDEILDKHVQALGGRVAIEKLTSRVSKGTFELDQMPGPAAEEIYQKAPNKQLMITDAPSFGVVRFGFNGSAGWQEMPPTGLQDVTGSQLAAMKRNTPFYRDIMLKEIYPQMVLKGQENVDGRNTYVIEATPADGSAELLYFDVDSGLLVRTRAETEGPTGKVMADTTLDDFREVDGVKIPFTIRHSQPAFGFVIKLTEVEHNVPIDDAKFDKPTTP